MASLASQNPHAAAIKTRSYALSSSDGSSGSLGVIESYRSCHGSGVTKDSKHILSVRMEENEFLMADIRLIESIPCTNRDIVLELFFDGELSQLKDNKGDDLKQDFLDSLQCSIMGCVQEYFKRRMQSSLSLADGLKSFRQLEFPDVTIHPIGTCVDDAFRDAGCMLSFIAVRIRMNQEAARAIGGVVFPSFFGMPDPEAEIDTPVPKWLVGMGAATVVIGVATIYAWTRIIIYGNQFS